MVERDGDSKKSHPALGDDGADSRQTDAGRFLGDPEIVVPTLCRLVNIGRLSMRRVLLTLATGICLLAAGSSQLPGAELALREGRTAVPDAVGPHCWRARICGPAGCEWRRRCWHACAGGRDSRYTCGPLYGAYGPWGGRGYWDAYTMWY
jgi:hypothetical protein